MFQFIGVVPVVNHYYEPLFSFNQLSKPLNSKRELPRKTNKIYCELQLPRGVNAISGNEYGK